MFISADGEWQAAAVSFHQLLKEAFRRGNVPLRAQHEFDCAPHGIDCAIEILPFRTDLDVGLIEAVGSAAHLQVRPHPPVNLRSIPLYPPPHGSVIHRESALSYHLLQVAI